MALNYVGSRNGAQRNLTDPIVITNAHVVSVGDAVEVYSAGTAGNPTAAQPIKGIVAAITDSQGLPILQGANTAGSANSPATTTVTADTTQYVLIDTATSSLYSAEVSGTLGTTNSSGTVGARVDIDSANTDYGQLLESTATRTIGTPANFYVHKTDPNDSTRLIVSLAIPEELSVFE
jgi:hypothetical protein